MKERIKNVLGFIGIVLLIWFFVQIMIDGSSFMGRAEERCALKGGHLDKYTFCIVQEK